MGFIQPALPIQLNSIKRNTCTRRSATSRLPQPVGDRILVRRDSTEKQSSGGLVLTGETEKCSTGEVLATGKGRYSPNGTLEEMPVSVGDHVFWKDEYGAEEIPGEKDLVLLRAFSISAKI